MLHSLKRNVFSTKSLHTHVAPTYLQVSYSVVSNDICGQRSDKFPNPDDFHAQLRSDGWTLACGDLGLQGATHRGSCIGYIFKVASLAASGQMKCWKSPFVFRSTPKLRGIRQPSACMHSCAVADPNRDRLVTDGGRISHCAMARTPNGRELRCFFLHYRINTKQRYFLSLSRSIM